MRQVDRRSLFRLGAGSLGAAAIAGRLAPSSPAGAAPKAAPKVGGQLRVGVIAESNGLSPISSQITTAGTYYARAIFDPIAIVAADGSVQPYLCQSITPNSTYTVWTFKLRPGIMFHDGTPLDSAALANHFQHVLHSPFSATSPFNTVSNIVQPDSLTVTLQLASPWVSLPAFLTGAISTQEGFVVAPSMLNDPNGAQNPVGTGPFIFVSWEPGSHLVVRRNPHYWQKGLPYLSQITFSPIVDDTSRLQSLQAGTLDLIQMSGPLEIDQMMNASSLNVITNVKPPPIEPSQSFILLNTKQPPLDDLRIRQALAYATDQQRVIQVSGGGLGAPSSGLFPPGNKYYAPTGYPTFNLRKAKALVAQWRAANGGASPTFPLQVAGTTYVDMAQQLQQMWKQAGINVSSILTLEQATFIQTLLQGKFSAGASQQFEAADPDQNYPFWSGRFNGPLGQTAIDWSRFSNATVDQALETGRSVANPAVRKKAYQTVNKQFAENIPYLWITRQIWAVGAAKNVQGFQQVSIPSGGHALALMQGDIWLQQIHVS